MSGAPANDAAIARTINLGFSMFTETCHHTSGTQCKADAIGGNRWQPLAGCSLFVDASMMHKVDHDDTTLAIERLQIAAESRCRLSCSLQYLLTHERVCNLQRAMLATTQLCAVQMGRVQYIWDCTVQIP